MTRPWQVGRGDRPPLPAMFEPYRPIPAGELPTSEPHELTIRPLTLVFRTPAGGAERLETSSSAVALARLRAAARLGDAVVRLTQAGRYADPESVAALNCYLRSAKTMGRMLLPWDRLPEAGSHRYAWSAFCEYIGLSFAP